MYPATDKMLRNKANKLKKGTLYQDTHTQKRKKINSKNL